MCDKIFVDFWLLVKPFPKLLLTVAIICTMSLVQYPINWAATLASTATSYVFDGGRCAFPPRTVIENVHVWDGEKRIPNTTIVIEGRTISLTGDTYGAKKVDGKGGFLMPGLIDSHVHASTKRGLDVLAHYGITTVFDMGSFPSSKMPQWHDVGDKGIASLLFSGAAACVSGGFPSILPNFPKDSEIYSAEDATKFVETRVEEGADFLKIFINDKQLPKQEYQEIIKKRGEHYNKLLVSHAPDYESHKVARDVGGKFITHLPKARALDKESAQEMLDNGQVAIPTLIMMRNLINLGQRLGKPYDYTYSNESVALLYQMGVPILAGTDADKLLQGLVLYGTSLHTEMKLLKDAGMSTDDVLRSATFLPAKYFGLSDRGRILPGMRADLLLLSADPFDDISNSNNIVQIWTAGTAVKGLFGRSRY